MTRKILPIVLVLLTQVVFGQYKKCIVYISYPTDSQFNGIHSIQYLNDNGKLLMEREYGKYEGTSVNYHDTTLDRMTIFSYTKDTLIASKKNVYLHTDYFDTTAEYYYYDKNNRISYFISANWSYPYQWHDSAKTTYRYNDEGQLIEKQRKELSMDIPEGSGFMLPSLSPNRFIYNYDKKGRVFKIHKYNIETLRYNIPDYIPGHLYLDTNLLSIETYKYKKRSYTIAKESKKMRDTTVSIFHFNKAGSLISEQIDTDVNQKPNNGSRYTYSYYPDGRLQEKKKYFNGKLERTYTYTYE